MKNKRQTIRLWSPLFSKLSRRSKLGFLSNTMTKLDSNQLLPYQEAIEQERFPGEGERRLTEFQGKVKDA